MKRDTRVTVGDAWFNTSAVDKIDRSNCGIVYPMEKVRYQILKPDGSIAMKEIPILDKKKKVVGTEVVPVSEHYGIVTSDDYMPIGNPVKAGYQLISNEAMFDMIEQSLAGTSHKIVAVGTGCDLAKVYCSIQLGGNIIAGNRETENVLNILWGHGGVWQVNAVSGFTVIVCHNQFRRLIKQAKYGKSEFKLRMKHTGNAEMKIENMGKAIEGHYGVVAEFKKAMDDLAAQSVTPVEAKRIFAGFLVDDENVTEVPSRTVNVINRLETLFESGAGNRGKDMSDVFNAFTDYYTHESSSGDDNRMKQFESSEFGAGATAKDDAFDLLMGNRVKGLGTLSEVSKRGEKVLQLV